MQFFHLGVVSDTIYPFNIYGDSGFQRFELPPTLSPKDPNFPEWWEKHKSEWEDKKKGGQEPADD